MLEDHEMYGRDEGALTGRHWLSREEDDAWCALMCLRMAELPIPNLGIELKVPDDDGVSSLVLEVSKVFPGPACDAGLQVGDIVVSGNGIALDTMEKFRQMLKASVFGGLLVLDVYRPQPEGTEGLMRWLVLKVNLTNRGEVPVIHDIPQEPYPSPDENPYSESWPFLGTGYAAPLSTPRPAPR